MSFWNYCLLAVAFFISYMFSALAVLTPIMVLRVSFPLTSAVSRSIPDCGISTVKKMNWFSFLLWLAIDAIIIILVVCFVPTLYAYAVLSGAAACALFSLGKTGMTDTNCYEYAETNLKYIKEKDRDQFISIIQSLAASR